MDAALLDTDILSEVLKRRNAAVAVRAVEYLRHHLVFTISSITRYEVRRGHLAKDSYGSLERFERFCWKNHLLSVTMPVLDRAAALWALAQHGGFPGGDADLIIAATALESDLTLVTGNTPHFNWIPGLRLENWRLT